MLHSVENLYSIWNLYCRFVSVCLICRVIVFRFTCFIIIINNNNIANTMSMSLYVSSVFFLSSFSLRIVLLFIFIYFSLICNWCRHYFISIFFFRECTKHKKMHCGCCVVCLCNFFFAVCFILFHYYQQHTDTIRKKKLKAFGIWNDIRTL